MKRWLALMAVWLMVFCCTQARAQAAFFDGNLASNGTICPVSGIAEIVLQTRTGYFTDPTVPFPKTGDLTYIHAVATNVSSCVSDAPGFEFFLPEGASLAIDATNQVYCFLGNTNVTSSTCSQTPSLGSNGGFYFGFSTLGSGQTFEVRVPVVFNKKLLGLAGPASHKLSIITSSAYGTVYAEQAVTSFYSASFQNLATNSTTSSTADLAFTLNSYYNTGQLYVDFGTTTALGSSTTPASVPNTQQSFNPTVQLTGLNPATTYYWQARFVTPDGTFTSSPLQSFTTAGGTPQTLTISKNGTGTGNVTSSPAGIDCGLTCSASFAQGTSVTLTAAPVVGSSFTGWSGACTGTALTCTFVMNAASSVNASFARDLGSLSLSVVGLPVGSSATLGVTGPDGYNVPQTILTGMGVNLSDVPTGVYTITAPDVVVNGTTYTPDLATRNLTVNAVGPNAANVVYSAAPTFALNVTKAGTGSGVISSNPVGINCGANCTANFAPGSVVELSVSPDRGSVFSGWDGACAFRQSNTTCSITINADTNVSALFESLGSLEVAVNGLPSGSSAPLQVTGPGVTDAPTVVTGTSQFYNNIATGTYTVSAPNVLVAGITYIPNLASQTANIFPGTGGSQVVTVIYRKQIFTFNLTKSGTGTGAVSSDLPGIDCGLTCNANFDEDTKFILTAKPDAGSSFVGWSGAGCSGTGTCVVTMSANLSVNAEFSSNTLGALDLSVNGLPAGESAKLEIIDGNGVSSTVIVQTGVSQLVPNLAPSKYEIRAPDVIVAGTTYTPDLASQTVRVDAGLTSTVKITYKIQIPTFALTVSKNGTGTGTVSSTPTGIDCGATCTSSFNQATVVTLTPTAASGSSFAGWSGACTGTGACTVTMDAAKGVTATFNTNPIPTFALTTTKSGTGTGTISSSPAGIDCGTTCTANFNQSTVVTLTPTAAAGSSFAGWTGACTGTTVCTVTMDAVKTITATFNLIPKFALTVAKNGTGAGTVSSTPAGIDCGATCNSSFLQSTVVTLTATAASGSSFAGWSGDCTGTGACVVTMDAAKNVTATFNTSVVPTFGLSVNRNGTGTGTVSSTPNGINCGGICTANFDQNTGVILTATADAGSSFAGWTGACTGLTTCSVTMDAAKTVTATFNLIPKFALIITKNGTGTGSISSNPVGIDCGATCNASFLQSTVVTLTATAAAGSSFAGWTGDCTGTGACTITMDAAKNVTATFNTNVVPTFALTVTNAGTGTGNVSSAPNGINCPTVCNANFAQATSVTLTPTPASGSSFVAWGGACTGTGTCTVTMDAVKNVTATFNTNAVPTFALTLTKVGAGTVSSTPAGIDCGTTCTSSFNQGTSITLTATPAVGSSFTGWTGACTGTATCVVTMDAAKSVTATFKTNPPANVASSKPSNAPADRMVIKGSSDNAALAFAFTLPNGSLSSITLNVSGSGNDATDLSNVKLYKDSNANGLVDAGEPLLASGKFLGNDGTLTLTPASVALLSASGATQFVVAVDVNNTLAALRFAPVLGGLLLMGLGVRRRHWLGAVGLVLLLNSCQPPMPAEIRTYQINLTAIAAKDSSNLAVNITGLPIAGATLSVEK